MSGEILITPGKRWTDDNEPVTTAGLDATGQPIAEIPPNSIGATELIDGSVGSTQLDAETNAALLAALGRNYLLNPRFDLWTRKAVFTYSTFIADGLDYYYAADRWLIPNSNDRTWSRVAFSTTQTAVPDYPIYYLRWQQTGALTVNPGYIAQRVEGVQTLAGQTVTFAIWVRCGTNITLQAQIAQHFGAGGSPDLESTIQGYAITANIWTRIVYTVDVPALTGKVIDNTTDNWLEVRIIAPQGITFDLDFAHAQLNLGSNVAPFEYRAPVRELSLCNYYFERTQAPVAKAAGLTDSLPSHYFNAPKRTIPSLFIESVTTGTGTSDNTFAPLSINGFYQTATDPNSAVAIAVVLADCELYP
jgi:hypothetical protein